MGFICSKQEVFEYSDAAIDRLTDLYDNGYSDAKKEEDDEDEYKKPSKNIAKMLFGKTMRGDETPNLSSEGMESALGYV